MKYCTRCGSDQIALRVPEGDQRERWVCAACGHIHYTNPKIVCGVVPCYGERILLCRRGIEPRLGLWTLPAGFMEDGETVEEGALRELDEEARVRVTLGPLISIISVPHISQVHMMFLGEMAEPRWQTTPESTEIALFSASEIPWNQLAFRTVQRTLRHVLDCREKGQFVQLVDCIR